MPIPIDKLVRSRRKTVALIVERDGTLTVRAPLRLSNALIREFVESHTDWILKNKVKAKTAAPPSPRTYAEGELFPFLGRSYPLHVVPRQSKRLEFDGRAFRMTRSTLPGARDVFMTWYKAQARQILQERVDGLARENNFGYGRLRITSARTRWGSCSTSGTLSFTYRLVMAPPEVVDYVIIHELVHTQVPNHSKTFWQRVEMILPEYKKYRTWLKKNGHTLT